MPTLRIADAVGRVLDGKYRLIRPIGAGASAYVYVADEIELRRRVAVKILHPGLAGDQDFLRRFRSEARAVAALQHPNILRVYAYGQEDGDPFLVTELLEGGSLRALLDNGHLLTWSQAATIGLAAAQALQHAHGRGLVHRDIKPANLLFDAEGRLHVADFGLARAVAESSFTVPSGAVVGTARYAAPETAMSRPADIKADVYSLALVLSEAITNVVPFAADTWQATLMARTRAPLEVPKAAGPLVPILEQAGTLDPEDRLDPLGLAKALEELLKTLPAPDPLTLAGLPAGQPGRDSNPTMLAGQRASNGKGDRSRSRHPNSESVLADRRSGGRARPGGRNGNGARSGGLSRGGAAASEGDEPTIAWRSGSDADGGPPTQALPLGQSGRGVFDREASERAAAIDAAADAAAEWGAQADRERLDDEFDAMMAGRRTTVRRQLDWEDGSDSEQRWNQGAEAGWAGPGWDDEPPAGADEPEDLDEPRQRRRWPVVLAAAVVLFLLGGGGAYAWIQTHQPPPLSVVPSLTGDTEAQARHLLTQDHLVLQIAGASYDPHAAKGTILSGQSPAAGGKLHRGQKVAVTISRGPKPVRVPSLKGLTRYRAHQLLAKVGLKIDKISRRTSVTVPTDLIIRSRPSTGTLLPGEGVEIVISSGKPTVTVPLLTGPQVLSYSAAATALKADHFAPSEALVYNNQVPKGEVVTTSPGPHATELWGSAVKVIISKGPELVQVPDVTGETVGEADSRLTAAGFVVSGVTGPSNGKVTGTNPAANTEAVFGSQIQIIATAPPSHHKSSKKHSKKHH